MVPVLKLWSLAPAWDRINARLCLAEPTLIRSSVMSMLSRVTIAFVFCLICISPALAAKKNKGQRNPADQIKKKLAAAELPSDTLEKAKKIVDENAPKLKEAQAKVNGVLTAEQQSAQKQARKNAKSSGKKGKEAKADIAAAAKLTPEQKTKLAAAESELNSARAAITRELSAVLSPDQMAKAGLKTKKKKA